MDLEDVVAAVGTLWKVETSGWRVIVRGESATVHLPRPGVAVHVARAEVTDPRVEALHTARARLKEAHVPVLDLLPSAAGSCRETVGGRVIEVERWIKHDGRMNTWPLLQHGAGLLARVHSAWRDLDLGRDAEACDWANWISPVDTVPISERAARELSAGDLSDAAEGVIRLGELTSEDFALPEQVVHGDFWDNNVYVRDERLIAVTDFDFLGRRPRIDDLALMLYFADEQPYFTGSGHRSANQRLADLVPLVRAYGDHLTVPLSQEEITALPYALTRQPLWTYSKWALNAPDQDRVRRDVLDTAPAISRALEVMAHPDQWSDAFASGQARLAT